MAEEDESLEEAPPAPGERAPHEAVLLLAAIAAAACAGAAILGGVKGFSSPTLGVLFVAGVIESLVALGLAVKVLLVDDRNKALFIPGAVLAALATVALASVFLLSGSV